VDRRQAMAQLNAVEDQPAEEIDEYHKMEFREVFERIGSLQDLRVQLGTFFGTANLTALGVALAVQKAGVFFVSAAILVLFTIMDRRARKFLAAYYYRGLQLQKRYAPDDRETSLRIHPGGIASEVREISELQDSEVRLAALNRVSAFALIGFWIPLSVITLEVIAGLVLWLVFNWPLF